MEAKESAARKVSRKEALEEKRKNRIPLESRKQKMAVDIPRGFVGRWFNDTGGRIHDARRAGWEFLDDKSRKISADSDDLGTMVRLRVDRKLTNAPVYAYLMVIEKELYNEDQARKADAIISTEKDIVRGVAPQTGGKIDGELVYVKEADLSNKPL